MTKSSSVAPATKETATRVYSIAHKETGDVFALVEATSGPQALKAVTSDLYTVGTPSALTTAKLMDMGIELRTREAAGS